MRDRIVAAVRSTLLAALLLACGSLAWAQRTSQTLAFWSIPEKSYAGDFLGVNATASSGLPVEFAAGGACSLTFNGVQLHAFMNTLGTCILVAVQPGNEAYEPVTISATIDVTWKLQLTLPAITWVGTQITAKLQFDDRAAPRQTECAIDWDTAVPGIEAGAFDTTSPFYRACVYSHVYRAPGVYNVTAALSDAQFGFGAQSGEILVLDRATLGVRGAGSFHSPTQTFRREPALSGNLLFHIDSRYDGGTSPTGTIWFALEGTNAWFLAETQDRIEVVDKHTANISGRGRSHEGEEFTFHLTVTDKRGTGIDTISLVLRDAEGVVYTTQYWNWTGTGAHPPPFPPPATLQWGDISLTY